MDADFIRAESKKEHFAVKSKPKIDTEEAREESKKEHFAVKSKLIAVATESQW